jgi:hypothetical protein
MVRQDERKEDKNILLPYTLGGEEKGGGEGSQQDLSIGQVRRGEEG